MTPEAARAAALRKFGNATRIAEDTWSVWRTVWLDRLLQDARYAFRRFVSIPVSRRSRS